MLIFGAGDAGELIVRDMKTNRQYPYQPVGFIDDDPAKGGTAHPRRPGARHAARPAADSRRVPARRGADRDPARRPGGHPVDRPRARAVQDLRSRRCRTCATSSTARWRSDRSATCRSRISWRGRRSASTAAPLQQLIAGRRVMVTGAGGSIGSELCRQIAQAEAGVAGDVRALREQPPRHPDGARRTRSCRSALHAVVGDVTDAARVERRPAALHQPEIIFHAAAHKHVPLMEENPCEAIKNNVRGTRLLAEAAERHGVDRFIMISTDKAVNPTSVMGASKRLAELVVQAQAAGSGTSFAIVRFGNVLGSNGSVVPRFLEQIRKGGPVTVTHPEMRRYFMLIPEAVQLVLHAAAQAESGATYVLEMGEQVKLVDLARDLIRLSASCRTRTSRSSSSACGRARSCSKSWSARGGGGPSTVEKILCVRGRRRPPVNLHYTSRGAGGRCRQRTKRRGRWLR